MRKSLLLAGLAIGWLMGCNGEEEPVIATGIQASPETISLNAGEEATLEIKTIPGGIAQWSVFDKPDWLSLSQEEGTINGSGTTLTLTSSADGLEPDAYTGTIGIFSTAGQATAKVTLFIAADPQVGLSAAEINFPEGVNENTLQITNEGLGALNYTFSSDISWLSIEPPSGTLITDASQELTLTVDRTYIVAGTYNGEITVSSNADHGDKTIPVMIEVPEIATISSDLDTVGFNYFVDGQQLIIQNDGNITYDYSVTSQNNLVTILNSTGSLEMGKNTTVSLTAVRDGLGTGVFTDVLTISNNKGESIEVKIGLLNYVEEKWLVDGAILDAEYDRNNDVIIAVSSQALRIIDPVSKSENTISLAMNAKNVSLSPDGNFAAVGHETSVSYIDLTTRTLVNTYNAGTTVFDVVLAGNGYAYIFPESGTYNTHIYSLNLNTGKVTITGGTSYYLHAKAKLHPSGSYIYSVESGTSSASITKYDISKGNASFLYASGHSYDFDGNLWFSAAGDYLFARSADILQPSTDPATDLIPVSKLDQNEEIVTMDHSAAADRLYAVLTSTESLIYEPAPVVNIYNGTNFGYIKTVPFPKYLIADNNSGGKLVDAYANYGFFNSAGTEFYAITVDAETESSQAIITIPVN